MEKNELTKSTLIGFAVGDAFGVPFEFLTREQVRNIAPTEMVGKEDDLPFESRWSGLIPSGCFSDDTSMLIAGMDSIASNGGMMIYEDVMSRYISWIKFGNYSSTGKAFGLGGVVSRSLWRFVNNVPALECGGKETHDNGNGSLMRILPFSLYAIKFGLSQKFTAEMIGEASSLTHAHPISKLGCYLYTEFLRELSLSADKQTAFQKLLTLDLSSFPENAVKAYSQLLDPEFPKTPDSEINEKNGYVVTTLISAIHSLMNTDNYESVIIKAAYLVYDTDTICGVTGSLAAAIYGLDAIPERWLGKLRHKDELLSLAERFDAVFDIVDEQ